MELSQIETRFEQSLAEIAKVIVGQEELVEAVLVALLSEGNVLI